VPVAIDAAAQAPAAPEPAKAEAPTKFEPTGDPGLDLAYNFIGKLGIKADDPALAAAKAGDFSLISAKLSALGDKAAGWQEHLALAKDYYTREEAKATEAAKKTAEAVYGVVGGKDTWDKVQAWASSTASPEEKAELNAQFAAGGLAAKAAARYLHDLWARNSGQAQHKSAASPNASATAAVDTSPLSAKQYTAIVAELTRKHPGKDLTRIPEYSAAQARRSAGLRAGL
jgi:hypothetical protein